MDNHMTNYGRTGPGPMTSVVSVVIRIHNCISMDEQPHNLLLWLLPDYVENSTAGLGQ